jgi:hypothetical protein
MKFLRIALIVAAVLGLAFFGLYKFTKSKSPEATAKFDQNGLTVQVDYCQPYKKGRVVFGELVPYGKVWRTGANAATIIDLKQDVKIAEKSLKAGKYTLWTVPTASNWTIVINSETGQWGTNYDGTKDVLRVDVPSSKSTGEAIEQFQIDLKPATNGTDMVLRWENTEVSVPIRL